MTVTDDDLGVVSTTAQVNVNGPPTADAGGPYTGSEGLRPAWSAPRSTPRTIPLTTTLDLHRRPRSTRAGPAPPTGATTLVPDLTCTDDASSPRTSRPTTASTRRRLDRPPSPSPTSCRWSGPVDRADVARSRPARRSRSRRPSPTPAPTTRTRRPSTGVTSTSSTGIVSEIGGSGTVTRRATPTRTAGLFTITVTVTDDDLGPDCRVGSVLVNTRPDRVRRWPVRRARGRRAHARRHRSDLDGDSADDQLGVHLDRRPRHDL